MGFVVGYSVVYSTWPQEHGMDQWQMIYCKYVVAGINSLRC
jgi:hypothetical protein